MVSAAFQTKLDKCKCICEPSLNYETTSEHLDFDFMVLYNAFVLSWGLTITQNSIRKISDLESVSSHDTRSAENDRIGADTILSIGSMHPYYGFKHDDFYFIF